MGFPTEFFPVLFAIPRMAGYLSHWRESLDDPDTKIMRPQQVTSWCNIHLFFCPVEITQNQKASWDTVYTFISASALDIFH